LKVIGSNLEGGRVYAPSWNLVVKLCA